ncbi:MAG: ribosome maturation factor RimM [Pseudomonadales bacterium]
MDREALLVGRVTTPWGLNGWVKIFSYTDPIEQIFSYNPWQLWKDGQRTLNMEESKVHGKHLVVRLEGIDDRNKAESLAGAEVWIDTAQLPELEDGEYYWHQLEGLTVINAEGEVLGDVRHLTATGANDILVVEPTVSSVDEHERLIPYVEDNVVKQVDLESRRILVSWDADF